MDVNEAECTARREQETITSTPQRPRSPATSPAVPPCAASERGRLTVVGGSGGAEAEGAGV